MKDTIWTFFKGLWIGGSMTVPGISGGSMAMILGIYNHLITAVSSFRKKPKENFLFLLKFLVGGLLGVVLVSKYVLEPLLTAFPLPTRYFFLGAVAGGIPIAFKTTGVKKVSVSAFLYPLVGIVLVLLIGMIPKGLFSPTGGFGVTEIVLQLLGGIIVAIAFILPGISVSQILYMLGLYTEIMTAINTMDFLKLLSFFPLAIGVVAGSLACAKVMERAMEKHPQPTYLIVFGFLLGSLPELLPGVPSGVEIPICILSTLAGFALIYVAQSFESHKAA